MGTVRKRAEEVKLRLSTTLLTRCKAVISQLALAVGARLEAPTPNPTELANVLPLPTERQDMREPWRWQLLEHPLLESPPILEPFVRAELVAIAL